MKLPFVFVYHVGAGWIDMLQANDRNGSETLQINTYEGMNRKTKTRLQQLFKQNQPRVADSSFILIISFTRQRTKITDKLIPRYSLLYVCDLFFEDLCVLCSPGGKGPENSSRLSTSLVLCIQFVRMGSYEDEVPAWNLRTERMISSMKER